MVVLFSVIVFATGVALLLLGRSSRDPWLLVHKPVPVGGGHGAALGAGLVVGLVLAVALLGQFSAWTQ